MDEPYKVECGGSVHELEAKSLTLIFHPGELDVNSADSRLVTIDSIMTVQFANTIPQANWENLIADAGFLQLWKKVWVEVPPPVVLSKGSMAFKHTVGLILLVVEAVALGKTPFVKLPETYMHPKQCAALADFFAFLSNKPDTPVAFPA